jgi:hypothetical protein
MRRNHYLANCTSYARGFAAFWAALVLTILVSARPAQAWHFAYVTNDNDNTVSVIDTTPTQWSRRFRWEVSPMP